MCLWGVLDDSFKHACHDRSAIGGHGILVSVFPLGHFESLYTGRDDWWESFCLINILREDVDIYFVTWAIVYSWTGLFVFTFPFLLRLYLHICVVCYFKMFAQYCFNIAHIRFLCMRYARHTAFSHIEEA